MQASRLTLAALLTNVTDSSELTNPAGSQSFSFYADGIYDESPRLITLNHAVQLVGYTEDAWILRNSWATGWGKDGYMLLARNTGKRKGVLGEVVTPAFVTL